MHDGALQIHKDELNAAQYIVNYQSFLTQTEIEDLSNLMEKCHLDSASNIDVHRQQYMGNLEDTDKTKNYADMVSDVSPEDTSYQQRCGFQRP